MTLTDFLLARIGEDEDRARYVAGVSVSADRRWHHHADGNIDEVTPEGWSEPFMPARVLAECEAKRLIVEEHPRCDVHDSPGNECDACLCCGDGSLWPCDTLRAVGAIYSGHPDYREEWRP